MKRRNFIKKTAVTATGLALYPNLASANPLVLAAFVRFATKFAIRVGNYIIAEELWRNCLRKYYVDAKERLLAQIYDLDSNQTYRFSQNHYIRPAFRRSTVDPTDIVAPILVNSSGGVEDNNDLITGREMATINEATTVVESVSRDTNPRDILLPKKTILNAKSKDYVDFQFKNFEGGETWVFSYIDKDIAWIEVDRPGFKQKIHTNFKPADIAKFDQGRIELIS
ncbi:MAG: hypothetical protein AAFX87_15040 [Bacteroidota bacterium]